MVTLRIQHSGHGLGQTQCSQCVIMIRWVIEFLYRLTYSLWADFQLMAQFWFFINGLTYIRWCQSITECSWLQKKNFLTCPKRPKAWKETDPLFCLFADQFNMLFPWQQLVDQDTTVLIRWFLFDFLNMFSICNDIEQWYLKLENPL